MLLEKGISVIDSTSFPGAENGFLRIKIGTRKENEYLVNVLFDVDLYETD